jgi:pimeloyl-ACP methyl ester carboxylesterase
MRQTEFLGKSINYKVQGEGEKVLFLLHGYLESLEIWNDFADKLAEDYTVISMDIPGHGNSDVLKNEHDMDLLANAVKHVLDEEQVNSCTMVGHSLGGYVTLAFLANYPGNIEAFSLFHSHPFADSDQVKENRKREISLVEQGKKKVIINTNIPKAFANDNLEKFKNEVEWARQVAINTPGEGIIANLKAMMNRPDRSDLVKNTDKPFLLIAGLKDNYINYEQVIPKIVLPEKGVLVTFENSGHIGFIEEKENALHVMKNFIN